MRAPFLLRVHAPTREQASALARAIASELALRGLGVRVDGEDRTRGSPRVDVVTSQAPACLLEAATRPNEPSWLPSVPLPADLGEAEAAALRYLERWGFTPAAPGAR